MVARGLGVEVGMDYLGSSIDSYSLLLYNGREICSIDLAHGLIYAAVVSCVERK